MTVNLFSLLENATISGTWSLISGPAPAPAAPVTYNDEIEFDNETHPYGTFIYEYKVDCDETSRVTIEHTSGPVRSNDACAGAAIVNYFQTTPSSRRVDNQALCPKSGAPTKSDITTPPTWVDYANSEGDLWYFTNINKNAQTDSDPSITISLSTASLPLLAPKAEGLMLAIYTGTCASLTLVYSGYTTDEILSSFLLTPDTTSGPVTYFIRVASITPGNFDIIVSGDQTAQSLNPIE